MSSNNTNIENPLELIQKTYNLQTRTTSTVAQNNNENSSHSRPSVAKVSIHQPSRKSSVHDVQEVTKDQLNKILIDIQENLSRLKILLETMNSVSNIREEFFKLKDHLSKKIDEFIQKLANESGKRGSIISKSNNANSISHYPQYLVYSIEYFRSELVKSKYLFNSLISTSSIGSATLDNVIVKSLYNPYIDQIHSNNEEKLNFEDINQIKKDISHLEEHIYILNQRYYTQIPDWQDDSSGRRMTAAGMYSNIDSSNHNRLRLTAFTHKFSRASSIASNEHSNFCTRIYQKCQIICCICTPNYI